MDENVRAILMAAGIYIGVVWLVSAVVTAADKKCARAHRRRVPEATLFLLALLGGALPMFVTMRLIRHKTRHMSFMIGLPAIIVLHIAVICVTVWFNLM